MWMVASHCPPSQTEALHLELLSSGHWQSVFWVPRGHVAAGTLASPVPSRPEQRKQGGPKCDSAV